jgi:hypothetical protein
MKNRITVSLLSIVVALPVGILVGIWADWSTWVANPGQVYVFQAEPYYQGDLVVSQNDLILLQHPDGSYAGLHIKILGTNPLCHGGDGNSYCLIDAPKTPSEYLFSCSSDDKVDQCPDPGLQPRATNTGPLYGQVRYFEDIVFDIKHLFGWNATQWKVQEAQRFAAETTSAVVPPASAAPPVVGANAYVYCVDPNTTGLMNRPVAGNPQWPTSIHAGQEFLWNTNDSLTLSKTDFCTAPPVSGTGNTWSCIVSPTAKQYTYQAQLQSCPTTSASGGITVMNP